MRVMFQSTHPRRVRRHLNQDSNETESFNPRTHVGCDSSILLWLEVRSGFNPRTHVGCDAPKSEWDSTPPRFQSTHPRRVRRFPRTRSSVCQGFNPRTHVGCDQPSLLFLLLVCGFNPRTHVGCDLTTTLLTLSVWSFNPRTHVGCDKFAKNIKS